MRIDTPDQTKAIKKLMASRRALWRNDGRCAADFPKFMPGMTTAFYVSYFTHGRHHVVCPMLHADREAPYLVGPEVTAETVQDTVLTLVEPCPYHARDCEGEDPSGESERLHLAELQAACLERFGVSDLAACEHLPAFADWRAELEAA